MGEKYREAAFYYPYGGRDDALDQIRRWIDASPGLVVLTGDKGSGRTTLLDKLALALDIEKCEWCFLEAAHHRFANEEELFQALATGFGLEEKPVEVFGDLLDRVHQFLHIRLAEGCRLLIVADDVNVHATEVIMALLRFPDRYPGLSLVVTGEKDLLDRIGQYPQPSVVHTLALRPLQAEEIIGFFQEFFAYFHLDAGCVRNAMRVDDVMRRTGGNLALLVREASQFIPRKARLKQKMAAFPKGHLVALLVVIALTALVYLYYPEHTRTASDRLWDDQPMDYQDTDSPAPDDGNATDADEDTTPDNQESRQAP